MLTLVGAPLLPFSRVSAAEAAAPNEYQLKAAFLFHFLQYVEWPRIPTDDAICVGLLGDDPFGSALTEVMGDEVVQGRKLTVRRSSRAEGLKGCELVFISRSEKAKTPEILAAFEQTPTLTVGETDGFTQQGGIVGFYLEGKKVRFEVNPGAARKKGLRISSQLLTLGKIVETNESNRSR